MIAQHRLTQRTRDKVARMSRIEAINLRAPGDYLFKCHDCKHNAGKDRTCIGDKRAIMCADCAYALPEDHEPRNIATDKHAQSVR